MSIRSLQQTGPYRFLIALLALTSWPGVAATQDDSAGEADEANPYRLASSNR